MASGGIIVLTLHRVLDEEDFRNTNSPRGMVMRSSTYEALLQLLSAECEIVTLTGISPSWTLATQRPRFAVTFDDGWKDTFAVAQPLSERYGAPITVFVCPGLVGKEHPFWPEQVLHAWRISAGSAEMRGEYERVCVEAGLGERPDSGERLVERLKELEPSERGRIVGKLGALVIGNGSSNSSTPTPMEATMTWDETTQMVKRGTQIGSHTFKHEILTTLTTAEAERELIDSKRAIEDALGGACKMFAYPSGLWSPQTHDLVAQAGHTQAFLNEPGVWRSGTDPWLIPRVNVWEGTFAGPFGGFSNVVFQYATFWRCHRAEMQKRGNNQAEAPPLPGRPHEAALPR
jgi:peptidoglycan/xylan/chitin deacetylase (PgdA/CDA1 family)